MAQAPNESFDGAGIAWWNGLDASERAKWLKVARSAVPADAYAAYLLQRTTQDSNSTVLESAIRELSANPDSPASLHIMSSMSRAIAPYERSRNQVLEALESQLAHDGETERAALSAAINHWERTFKIKLNDGDLAEMRDEASKRIVQRKRMPPTMDSILECQTKSTDTGYKLGVHLHGIEGTWHRLWGIISLAHSFGSDIQSDDGVATVREQFQAILGRELTPKEWGALVAHATNHAETVMKPLGVDGRSGKEE